MATALWEGSWCGSCVLLLLCSCMLSTAGLGKQGGQGSEGTWQRGPRWQRMGHWEGSPCGSRDGAAWQGVEGTQNTGALLPQLSKVS